MSRINVNSLVTACEQVLYPSFPEPIKTASGTLLPPESSEGKRYLHVNKNGSVDNTWKNKASSLGTVATAFHQAVIGIKTLSDSDPDKIRKISILQQEINSILLHIDNHKTAIEEGPWYKQLLTKIQAAIYFILSYDLPEETLKKAKNRLEEVKQRLRDSDSQIKILNKKFAEDCNTIFTTKVLDATTTHELYKQYANSIKVIHLTQEQKTQLKETYTNWQKELQNSLISKANNQFMDLCNKLWTDHGAAPLPFGDEEAVKKEGALVPRNALENPENLQIAIDTVFKSLEAVDTSEFDLNDMQNYEALKHDFRNASTFWRAEINSIQST